MEKTQVYLRKEELDLRKAAARSGCSIAELVRDAIRKVVLKPQATGPVLSGTANQSVRPWNTIAFTTSPDARSPMARNYLSRARSRHCAPIPKWRRRLQRAPLSRSYRSSSMRAGRPRQTSRSTPACSQQSTRQPLRADLRARPSWRALRARRSKARADRITTSWAPKWGAAAGRHFPSAAFGPVPVGGFGDPRFVPCRTQNKKAGHEALPINSSGRL
jgi:hypothetical protein